MYLEQRLEELEQRLLQVERAMFPVTRHVSSKFPVTPQEIICVVGDFYFIPASVMCGKRRPAKLTWPRALAVYFIHKRFPNFTHGEISALFGRGHNMVLNSIRIVEDQISVDIVRRREVEKLTSIILTPHDSPDQLQSKGINGS